MQNFPKFPPATQHYFIGFHEFSLWFGPALETPLIEGVLQALWLRFFLRTTILHLLVFSARSSFLIGLTGFGIWAIILCGKEGEARRLLDKMEAIYKRAQRGDIDKDSGESFFNCPDKALGLISELPKGKDTKHMRERAENLGHQMAMLLAVRGPKAAMSDEIGTLASLREKGAISDHEFQTFSERFKMTSGDRGSAIIDAISKLHAQYCAGAMSEGNYHAGLWSLLDKLDRKI